MNTKKIASRDNDNFKRWKSLLENRGIKKHQQFLASGEKIVQELALKNSQNSEWISEWIICEGFDAPSDFRGKSYTLTRELFKELDTFGTSYPLLAGSCPAIKSWSYESITTEAPPSAGLRLVCPLGDPANLGAVIRSAAALGCHSVILTKEAANPFLPKSIRSSAGSVFSCPLFHGPSLNEILDSYKESPHFIALDMQGDNISEFRWPTPAFLVMGEEGPGLPPHQLKKVTIPIKATVESLNAVIATSIALYSYTNSKK